MDKQKRTNITTRVPYALLALSCVVLIANVIVRWEPEVASSSALFSLSSAFLSIALLPIFSIIIEGCLREGTDESRTFLKAAGCACAVVALSAIALISVATIQCVGIGFSSGSASSIDVAQTIVLSFISTIVFFLSFLAVKSNILSPSESCDSDTTDDPTAVDHDGSSTAKTPPDSKL